MPAGYCLVPPIVQGNAGEEDEKVKGDKPYDYYHADDDGDDPEVPPWEDPMVKEKHGNFDGRSADGKDNGPSEVCL